jgi:hypothetical protein
LTTSDAGTFVPSTDFSQLLLSEPEISEYQPDGTLLFSSFPDQGQGVGLPMDYDLPDSTAFATDPSTPGVETALFDDLSWFT